MSELKIGGLLIKNTAVQMMGYGISLTFGLVSTGVISRYLGVEGFGQFNYIFAFFYFFLSLNDFGVNTVVVREVSKHRERAGEIIGAMLTFKLLVALTLVLAAWITIWRMHFSGELRNALCVYALILPVMALQLPSVIFQVVLKFEYPAMIGIGIKVINFSLLKMPWPPPTKQCRQ